MSTNKYLNITECYEVGDTIGNHKIMQKVKAIAREQLKNLMTIMLNAKFCHVRMERLNEFSNSFTKAPTSK